MRIDKYFSNLWISSRKETSKLAKKWFIKVNWETINKSDFKVKIGDKIEFMGENFDVVEDVTILLHKPAWYVSSDIDENNYPSYKKLLENCPYKNLVKIAGRLDVDTEWLLVLLSDGKKIHQLISPKKWKEKIYFVELEKEINTELFKKIETGIEIEDWTTLPARYIKIEIENNQIKNLDKIKKFWDFKDSTLTQIPIKENSILLAIKEWKFHQIKKMMQTLNNKVTYLKRLKLDNFELENLKKWEWKMIKN